MDPEIEDKRAGIEDLARRARDAALALAPLDARVKDEALRAVRAALIRRREEVCLANREDKERAGPLVESGKLSKALFKRLDIEGEKFDAVIASIDDVIRLPDPVGRVEYAMRLDEGLDLYRITCPIGVIGVIFEARPDAAVQISALTLKSANAVILKGGTEAERTNQALVRAIREGIASVPGMALDAVQLISTREEAAALLSLDRYIDLIIPRGSNDLVRSIKARTRIPVLGHADGICAVYVDRAADPEKAVRVVVDSKAQYPAACNAAETLLIHRDALTGILPRLAEALRAARVEIRADAEARRVVPWAKEASEEDYRTEFLDLVLAVKTVGSVGEAVDHINAHGSHHTDAIVTEDPAAADVFLSRVDSAGVMHNASTRFADGFRYGLGAEVGISTSKTHARGPVGLEGLVIHKYRLYGNGQAAGTYGPGRKAFLHERLPAGDLPGAGRRPG